MIFLWRHWIHLYLSAVFDLTNNIILLQNKNNLNNNNNIGVVFIVLYCGFFSMQTF